MSERRRMTLAEIDKEIALIREADRRRPEGEFTPDRTMVRYGHLLDMRNVELDRLSGQKSGIKPSLELKGRKRIAPRADSRTDIHRRVISLTDEIQTIDRLWEGREMPEALQRKRAILLQCLAAAESELRRMGSPRMKRQPIDRKTDHSSQNDKHK